MSGKNILITARSTGSRKFSRRKDYFQSAYRGYRIACRYARHYSRCIIENYLNKNIVSKGVPVAYPSYRFTNTDARQVWSNREYYAWRIWCSRYTHARIHTRKRWRMRADIVNGVRYKAYIERQVVPRSLLLQRFCPPRSSTVKFLVSNKGRIEIERSRKDGLSSTMAWNYAWKLANFYRFSTRNGIVR